MASPSAPYVGGTVPPSNSSGGPSLPSVISQAGNGLSSILSILNDIDRKMDSVLSKGQQFAGQMGGAGGGLNFGGSSLGPMTSSNGMPIRGMSMPWQPNMTSQGGGTSGGTPGGGSQPAFTMRQRIGGVAIDAAASMGFAGLSAAGSTTQQAYGNSVMFQRLATTAGQGFTGGHGQFQQLQAGFQGGYVNQNDLLDTVNSMYNMGWGGAAMNSGVQAGMAQFAQATNNTLAGTQSMMAGAISNPQTLIRARAFGITPLNRAGGPQGMSQTVNQVLKATWGGAAPSTAAVTSALSPYGNLRQNLENLGLSDEQISSLQPSITQWAQGGGGTYSPSASAGGNTLLTQARKRADSTTENSVKQWTALSNSINDVNAKAADMIKWLGPFAAIIGTMKGAAGAPGNPVGGGGVVGDAMKIAGLGAFDKFVLKGRGANAAKSLGNWAGEKIPGVGGDAGDSLFGDLGGPVGAIAAAAAAPAWQAAHGNFGNALSDLFRDASDISPFSAKIPGLNQSISGALAKGLGLGDSSGSSSAASPNAMVTGGGIGSLISFAEKSIGVPYVWGGGGTNGPSKGIAGDPGGEGVTNQVGFDCSGFVQYVFAHFGVQLPRTTWDQVKCGRAVAPANVQPGDLVFFDSNGHVGIALSANKMINAPHTGTSVQIDTYDPKTCSAIRRVMNVGPGGGMVSGTGAGTGSAIPSLLMSTMMNAQSAANVLGMNNVGSSIGMLGSTGTSSSAAGGTSAVATGAPSSVSGNAALVKQMAASKYGWTGGEWNALYDLLMKESGFNNTAQNPTSSAYGIFQFLNSTWGGYGVAKTSDPTQQTQAGLRYIKSRYGDPENAWQHEVADNWYDKGAWDIREDQNARLHKNEMVLPAEIAQDVRNKTLGKSGGSGSKTVVIHVHPANSSLAEARKFAYMVKDILEEEDHFASIGNA